jgi:hypothetical protein
VQPLQVSAAKRTAFSGQEQVQLLQASPTKPKFRASPAFASQSNQNSVQKQLNGRYHLKVYRKLAIQFFKVNRL